MLPDYLNLKFIIGDHFIEKNQFGDTFAIFSTFGECVASKNLEAAKKLDPIAINVGVQNYGTLFIDPAKSLTLSKMVASEIHEYLTLTESAHALTIEEVIIKDLDKILELSRSDSMKIEEVLETFFLYLKAHIPFKSANILTENNKSELKPFMTLDSKGKIKRDSGDGGQFFNISDLEEMCHINQKIYYEKDQKMYGYFPIAYNNYSLGVLDLCDILVDLHIEQNRSIITKFLTVLSHIIYQYQIKNEIGQSLKVSQDLRKYMSDNLFNSIAGGSGADSTKVQKKLIVSMYADIRSFTKISESLDPKVLVELLNIYFSELTPIIEESEGTIDKFVGDMITAFWNAPGNIENPEIKAVQAALKMQRAIVRKVAPKWKEAGIEHMGIGIGIHVGQAIVGDFGSKAFNNYTAIGPVTERAQWLESLARAAEVWVSESLYNKAGKKIPPPTRKDSNNIYRGERTNIYIYKPENYPDYTKAS